MSDESAIEEAVRDLVIANRILAHEDVIDDFGHISVRNPVKPNHFFLSRSRSPELVTREDIFEFTLEGEPVSGMQGKRPYAERYIHGAIYAARPDVHSVSHHHARSVLPFTVSKTPLRPVFHMGSVIGKNVPVWDSQPEFGDTNMLVDCWEMGVSLAKTLGNDTVVLLARHGAAVAASSVKDCVFTSVYLNETAEVLLNALPLGEPSYLTDGEIDMTASMLRGPMPQERAWTYYVKRAGYEGL
ncbi:class II aldolase/adducin family protein [Amorphus sp. 3PC139-8]|uniref:class II aldolase/adducin family protein n=1 Tax=Amorphus sp. 3PC139-8 TaxID=2735676 RepID=UPI00345CD0F9